MNDVHNLERLKAISRSFAPLTKAAKSQRKEKFSHKQEFLASWRLERLQGAGERMIFV